MTTFMIMVMEHNPADDGGERDASQVAEADVPTMRERMDAPDTGRPRVPEVPQPKVARAPDYDGIGRVIWAHVQQQAIGAVQVAIGQGRIAPLAGQRCVDCGVPAMCYDHRAYDVPLGVDPVCYRCNLRRGAASFDAARWLRDLIDTQWRARAEATEFRAAILGMLRAAPRLITDVDVDRLT